MFRSSLVLFCIALAVQAKPRKGPLTDLFGDKVKPFDVVDEPEEKIVGGEEVITYLSFQFQIKILIHGRRYIKFFDQNLEPNPIKYHIRNQ